MKHLGSKHPRTDPALQIAIACGGTGGHVFPGMATGQALMTRGHAVTLWLSGRSIESSTLHDWEGPVFRTGARTLGLRTLPAFLATLARSIRRLRRDRPDVLLAMGSYSSVPPVLAARMLGIPVVLHEANAVPGKAVAFLSRFARVTAIGFPTTARLLPGRATVCTGMPVRSTIAGQPPMDGFTPGSGFTVLVTGGSLGAHAVNERASAALLLLRKQGRSDGLRVIHQCGTEDAEALRRRYEAAGIAAHVSPFLREMGRAYAGADLAIARAGAATCAELCLCGLPAILIPLPTAVRDHQRLNAEAMVLSGGARLRIQSDLTPPTLASDIDAIRNDPAQRVSMRQALLRLAVPDAADQLAEVVVETVSSKQ